MKQGGQLFVSGDISYDALRQRTQTQRLKELCGVEFISERFPNIQYEDGALPVVGKQPDWPSYVAAPGIVTRLSGARALVESRDGSPVVTEFQLGQGRVIFSADPIELHGDPRYHCYAHEFYRALCENLQLKGEPVEPASAPVHCFRVPSQDQQEIVVLVNHSEREDVRGFQVPSLAGEIKLSLRSRLSGAIVVGKHKRIQAVESSADAHVNGELLIGSDLHFMAISMNDKPLADSNALLLLPMGEGQLRIPGSHRWQRPLVIVGEIAAGRWKQYESFSPERRESTLGIAVSATRSLSMMILCELADESTVTRSIETWVNQPWLLAS